MKEIKRNVGFDGRRFLNEQEWRTYLRRKPVRYIHKEKDVVCSICGNPGTETNPLQNAHRISFDLGVVYLGLTPEFLDSEDNIVTAHRKNCNSQAELDFPESMRLLASLGESALPGFLPSFIHDEWSKAVVVN